MFDVNKLEKEDLIEYIKKLYDVMDKKDRYIEALEEKVYMEEKLNILDTEIKRSQSYLRGSMARLEMFEDAHNGPTIIDLDKDEETDKVKEPKFMVGDIVTCSFLSGKCVVYEHDDSIYRIKNIENGNEYAALEGALTKVTEE